jgi:RHS repeat-associated protein
VTNANTGTVVSEQIGLPFGTMLASGSTLYGDGSYQLPNNHTSQRFTSYDRSGASGLDYAINRHYNAGQGRFTQVDPLGMEAASLEEPQTLNLYAYCANDPVNHTDPEGLFLPLIGLGIGALIGIIAGVAAAVVTVVVLTLKVSAGLSNTYGRTFKHAWFQGEIQRAGQAARQSTKVPLTAQAAISGGVISKCYAQASSDCRTSANQPYSMRSPPRAAPRAQIIPSAQRARTSASSMFLTRALSRSQKSQRQTKSFTRRLNSWTSPDSPKARARAKVSAISSFITSAKLN